jgi:hypothetical protein
MAKLKPMKREGEIVSHRFECPGCNGGWHNIPTSPKYYVNEPIRDVWEFNGDIESPTFSPSVLLHSQYSDKPDYICHSFVRNGQIEFLSDCTHQFSGKTIPLPEID